MIRRSFHVTALLMILTCLRSIRGFTTPCWHTATTRLHRPSTTIRLAATSVGTDQIARIKVKKILEADDSIAGTPVIIRGWVRTVRDQKKFSFIEINDGSTMNGIQAVAEAEIETYSEIEKFSTGAAVEVVGTVIKSIGKGQKYEIKASSLRLVGDCPTESYPLQKKRHSQEFLRTIAHLRPRYRLQPTHPVAVDVSLPQP